MHYRQQIQGTIDAVNYTSSGTTFTIDGTSYALSDVLQVLGSSTTTSSNISAKPGASRGNVWLK
jgi:hypothetical protein